MPMKLTFYSWSAVVELPTDVLRYGFRSGTKKNSRMLYFTQRLARHVLVVSIVYVTAPCLVYGSCSASVPGMGRPLSANVSDLHISISWVLTGVLCHFSDA